MTSSEALPKVTSTTYNHECHDYLSSRCKKENDVTLNQQMSPIMWSITYGNLIKTKLLIGQPHCDLNWTDSNGLSAVHFAINVNQPNILRTLIDAGAKYQEPDKSGSLPLEKAAILPNANCLKVLLHYNIDVNGNDGAAIKNAIMHGRKKCFKLLAKARAKLDWTCPDSGDTTVMMLIRGCARSNTEEGHQRSKDYDALLRYMLKERLCDPRALNAMEHNAPMVAMAEGTRSLLRYGID